MRIRLFSHAAKVAQVVSIASCLPVAAMAQPRPVPARDMAQAIVVPDPAKAAKPFDTSQSALYKALSKEQSTDAVALLIKQNLAALGRPCQSVMAYQIFRYSTGARTLKIKCARLPLLAMTISAAGSVQVIGGDGSIGDMLATDGRIYSLMGETLQTYMAEQKVRDTAQAKARSNKAIVAIAPEPVIASRWPAIVIALTGLLALAAAFLIWRFLSARHTSSDPGWALSSTDKDYMLDESREVYPNVFRHPRGFFISRGRRGKRRLFNSALAAMLYRDLGIKFGEIGE
jgi:hypothetical protein